MRDDKELLRKLAFEGVEAARVYIEQRDKDMRSDLYDRMSKEYDDYIKGVRDKGVDGVLENAYEIVMKEDIFMLFEDNEFHVNDIEIIAKADYPLDAIYQNWLDSDISYVDKLRDCVKDYAETEKRIEKEKKLSQKKTEIQR